MYLEFTEIRTTTGLTFYQVNKSPRPHWAGWDLGKLGTAQGLVHGLLKLNGLCKAQIQQWQAA